MLEKLKTFMSKKLVITVAGILLNHFYTSDPALAAKLDTILGTAYVIIQGLIDHKSVGIANVVSAVTDAVSAPASTSK